MVKERSCSNWSCLTAKFETDKTLPGSLSGFSFKFQQHNCTLQRDGVACPLPCQGLCGALNEKCPSEARAFECLTPSWWHCLGRLLEVEETGLARGSTSLWGRLSSLSFLCVEEDIYVAIVSSSHCPAFSSNHHAVPNKKDSISLKP